MTLFKVGPASTRVKIACSLAGFICVGCGGGGKSGGENSPGGGTTPAVTPVSVSLLVQWPTRNRTVSPSISAERLLATMESDGLIQATLDLSRPQGDAGNSVQGSFSEQIKPGFYNLRLQQYTGNSQSSLLTEDIPSVSVDQKGQMTINGQSLNTIDLSRTAQNLSIDSTIAMNIGEIRPLALSCELQPGIRATLSDAVVRWRLASSPADCSLDSVGKLSVGDFGDATVQATMLSGEAIESKITISKPSKVVVRTHLVPTGDYYTQENTITVNGDNSGFTHSGTPWAIYTNRNPSEGDFVNIYMGDDPVSKNSRTSSYASSYRNVTLNANVWGYVKVGKTNERVQGTCEFNFEDGSLRADGQDVMIFKFTPDPSDSNSFYAPTNYHVIFYPGAGFDFGYIR